MCLVCLHLVPIFCCAMRCISTVFAVMQCPSVTFVDHVRTDKHIFEIFFTVG